MLSRYWQNRFFLDGQTPPLPDCRRFRPRLKWRRMFEAVYVCDACGEEIVIPVDPSAGEDQTLTEDCPVCCRPQVISVTIDPNGTVHCRSELE
jgi:hypothetical protein